ncbi:MAG: hypothetical protein IJQ39_11915 [Thermoguttaceae bacterium]|nr:hypothetical protein [Thermoguttaceae bacterium]
MRDAIASKSGAFQMRPKHPNLLTEPDIVGGIINYQDQWCVVYRYFNGGNDPQGRPDRCVLATAWVRTAEAKGQNLYALLFCPVFLDVQRQALYQCPVQVPRALIEDCNCPVSQNDPQLAIYSNNPDIGSWSFRSPDEVEVIGKLFPTLIGDGLKSLQVLQSAAYMETFSGTPLASGITYVPKVEIPPENDDEDGLPDPQSSRRNKCLGILLVILFILSSLLIYDRLTDHSFIKLFIRDFVNIEEQNPNIQNPDDQNPDDQNPNGQESGRPIYPTGQQANPGNPLTEPNNDMSGMPLIKP